MNGGVSSVWRAWSRRAVLKRCARSSGDGVSLFLNLQSGLKHVPRGQEAEAIHEAALRLGCKPQELYRAASRLQNRWSAPHLSSVLNRWQLVAIAVPWVRNILNPIPLDAARASGEVRAVVSSGIAPRDLDAFNRLATQLHEDLTFKSSISKAERRHLSLTRLQAAAPFAIALAVGTAAGYAHVRQRTRERDLLTAALIQVGDRLTAELTAASSSEASAPPLPSAGPEGEPSPQTG